MAKATENKAQDAVDTAADGVRTAANKTADAVHDSVGAATDAVHDSVGAATDAVHDSVGAATDAVHGAVGTATGNVHDSVGAAQEQVAAGLHYASSAAAGFNDNAARTVKRYPVRTVLVVAAIGVITGFIVGVATANRS